MADFKVKLNKKQDYGTGATRDAAAGKGRFDLIPMNALLRLAKVYEGGAVNHGARNWELGMPLSRLVDSAFRHLLQHVMSKYMPELREEDHLSHAVWNIFGIEFIEDMIERGILPKKLDDLPRHGGDEAFWELNKISADNLVKFKIAESVIVDVIEGNPRCLMSEVIDRCNEKLPKMSREEIKTIINILSEIDHIKYSGTTWQVIKK